MPDPSQAAHTIGDYAVDAQRALAALYLLVKNISVDDEERETLLGLAGMAEQATADIRRAARNLALECAAFRSA